MANFTGLVAHNDHDLAVVASADTRKGSKVMCYSVAVDNLGMPVLTRGILAEGGDFPKFFVGNDEFGGKQLSLGIDWRNKPLINEDSLVREAYFEPRRTNDGKPFWTLTKERAGDISTLLKITTGHRSVLKAKLAMFSRVDAGSPEKIRAGTCKSRAGFENSVEEIWRMFSGDVIMVQFVSGQLRKFRAGPDGALEMLELAKVEIEKKIVKTEWEKALEAANAGDTPEKSRIPTRDWGRYQLIKLATSPEEWQVVYDHLIANIGDVRTKVHDAFMAGCPNVEFLLAFGAAWKAVPANKSSAATGIPDFIRTDTVRKGPPASRIARLRERSAADQALRNSMAGSGGGKPDMRTNPNSKKGRIAAANKAKKGKK